MFKFPYTNLHEINLDWILEKVKKFAELIPPMETAVDDVQTALDDATEAVNKAEQALEDAEEALSTAQEAKDIAEQAAQGTIADGAVTTDKLANGAVTSAKIATGAVTTTEILNGTILPEDLASGTAIANIANGTINGAKLASQTITSSYLSDGAVINRVINDGAVTNVKIADNAVTKEKLSSTIKGLFNRIVTFELSSNNPQTFPIAGGQAVMLLLGFLQGVGPVILLVDSSGVLTNVATGMSGFTSEYLTVSVVPDTSITFSSSISSISSFILIGNTFFN